MENLCAGKICQWVKGTVSGEHNRVAKKIIADIRLLESEQAYFAIPQDGCNLNEQIKKACEKGASIVVSEKRVPLSGQGTLILVENVVTALEDSARCYMEELNIPVIGITGSTGKTTTGEMIAQVLSATYNVHKILGECKDYFDFLVSIFDLTQDKTVAVFEMDVNAEGRIRRISEIIRPQTGIITNIGVSHIERYGSRQNILREKLEIIHGMKETGRLILNGDDELMSGLNGLLPLPVTFYGIDEAIPLHAFGIETLGEEGVRFTVNLHMEEVEITLPVPGIHQVSNALAAIACALEYGISNDHIVKGLAYGPWH